MSWRQKTVIRILLIVAVIVANDKELTDEIEKLSNHILHGDHGADREALR